MQEYVREVGIVRSGSLDVHLNRIAALATFAMVVVLEVESFLGKAVVVK